MSDNYEGQATYSPEDNKIRLYPVARLSAEEYARVRAAGFIWAPKQGLFVAPMWTPSREDLAVKMFGEIGDEDKSLVARSEERAERFEDYSEKRAEDAERAQKAVHSISDNIPFGQPILVGHHSEKRARKDAEKIENGMRRTVKMWETARYWEQRAAGAIRAAKYKERPDVRARRIKKLEAEKRKIERETEHADKLIKHWSAEGLTKERAEIIAGYSHLSRCFTLAEFPRELPASQYEGSMSIWSALNGGVITAEQAKDMSLKAHISGNKHRARWLAHYENRITYEKAMMEESGGTVADKKGPEVGGAVQAWCTRSGGWSIIQKVNKVSVTLLDNWGNGGGDFNRLIRFDELKAVMTRAEVDAARKEGRLLHEAKSGFWLAQSREDFDKENPPEPEPEKTNAPDLSAMRETLRAGVQVVTANQLFPTPAELAREMVERADIMPNDRVLEPSAGTGSLVDAILRRASASSGVELVSVEINEKLANHLKGIYQLSNVKNADFLSLNGEIGTFDKIIMNPPFENGADIKHIRHAEGKLRTGGKLIALCAAGPRQEKEFGDVWEVLPDGTFSEQGTGVRVALVTITK